MQTIDLNAESLLTSHTASALLQVNPSSINKWVAEGRIPAFRTPGGHRRIRARDLVSFLHAHEMPVPEILRPAGRKRLLWVDDDRPLLRSIGRALKRYSDQVDAVLVDNGVEALIKVGSFRPDVIALDVRMPNMDGIDVCRRLRESPETSHLDIVIVSAQSDPAQMDAALSMGVRAWLVKPVRVADVVELLWGERAATS